MQTTVSTATKIQNISLTSCLYNASGPLCTTAEHLINLGKSKAGAILTKSSTRQYRAGNPSPRYFENELGSINSMGLPNEGYEFYVNFIPTAQQYNKPYFLSVAGLSLEENLEILEKVNKSTGITAIELNLSCPNIPGKPQTGYDFERSDYVLEKVMNIVDLPLGVKLPPYFDIVHFEMMAKVLNKYPLAFVTCVNSIGNGLVIDVEKESVVIKPKHGFGGIGGDYIKPTALANVRKFYELLNKDIAIIGAGGVKNGQDAFEHILCGASAVQIGTQLMREGTNCFERVDNELKVIMKKKGYTCLEDFKGKLKSL